MKKIFLMLGTFVMLCGMWIIPVNAEGDKLKWDTDTTYYCDLDGDGVEDEIYMYEDEVGIHEFEMQPHTYRFNLVINGQNYPNILGLGWVRQIYLMDINIYDNTKEIIAVYGYRDSSWASVIRYENDEANYLYILDNDGNCDDVTAGRFSYSLVEDTLGMEPITAGNGTLYFQGKSYGNFNGVYTDKYQELERGILTQFEGEPIDISQTSNISVTLNDEEIQFDQPPIIQNERTMVPMRAIFEAMGCDVYWDGDSQEVDVWQGDENVMTLWIGENEMWTPNGYITLDVSPKIVNERTIVPVRAISESLGAYVKWWDERRLVDICYYPPYSGTTTQEYYYRNQADIINFGYFLNDNPYYACEYEYFGYYYSYDSESNIDYCIEEYLQEMINEGFEVEFLGSANGSDFYTIIGYDYTIYFTNDYLLEHIQVEIEDEYT